MIPPVYYRIPDKDTPKPFGLPTTGTCRHGEATITTTSTPSSVTGLYSQDKDFLKKRAYPYLREVAVFLDDISGRDADNRRKLPLIRFVYTAAEACAQELGLNAEAGRWHTILSECPYFDLDEDGVLTFAKGFPYNESHRHFSNQMAVHPQGLIDRSKGEADRQIIDATIRKLDSAGHDWWCGFLQLARQRESPQHGRRRNRL